MYWQREKSTSLLLFPPATTRPIDHFTNCAKRTCKLPLSLADIHWWGEKKKLSISNKVGLAATLVSHSSFIAIFPSISLCSGIPSFVLTVVTWQEPGREQQQRVPQCRNLKVLVFILGEEWWTDSLVASTRLAISLLWDQPQLTQR